MNCRNLTFCTFWTFCRLKNTWICDPAFPRPAAGLDDRFGAQPSRCHHAIDQITRLFDVDAFAESFAADIQQRDFVPIVGSQPSQDAADVMMTISQSDLSQSSACMRPKIFADQPGSGDHELLIDFVRLQGSGDAFQTSA